MEARIVEFIRLLRVSWTLKRPVKHGTRHDRSPTIICRYERRAGILAKKLTICIRGRLNIINFFWLLFSTRALLSNFRYDMVLNVYWLLSSLNIDIFYFILKFFFLPFFFILFVIPIFYFPFPFFDKNCEIRFILFFNENYRKKDTNSVIIQNSDR